MSRVEYRLRCSDTGAQCGKVYTSFRDFSLDLDSLMRGHEGHDHTPEARLVGRWESSVVTPELVDRALDAENLR